MSPPSPGDSKAISQDSQASPCSPLLPCLAHSPGWPSLLLAKDLPGRGMGVLCFTSDGNGNATSSRRSPPLREALVTCHLRPSWATLFKTNRMLPVMTEQFCSYCSLVEDTAYSVVGSLAAFFFL
jgi:hypothetical protein